MASPKTVKGALYDDNGTWVVRARVFDPMTGKVKQRSKSTGFKVKNSTKRKAEQTMRDGVIPVNFADYVEFPKAEKFEGKAYSVEQVAALLSAVEQEGEPIRSAVMLAVCYGLRREEICGLRWKDIDFDAGKLYIKNTVTQNGTLRIEAGRTKTDKSHRVIDLIDSTVPYLTNLKETHQKSGLTLDKVCVWPDGRAVRPDYITSKTGKVMKAYGLERIRVHDLRHPYVKPKTKKYENFFGECRRNTLQANGRPLLMPCWAWA